MHKIRPEMVTWTEPKLMFSGKIGDFYTYLRDGEPVGVIVRRDSISVFDRMIPGGGIIGRNIIGNIQAGKMFELIERSGIVRTHLISYHNEDMHPFFQQPQFMYRCMLVYIIEMYPIEAIGRRRIVGSFWKHYSAGEREICGITIRDGMVENQRFRHTLYTPTSKEDRAGMHDENLTYQQTVELVGEEIAAKIRATTIKLFDFVAAYVKKNNMELIDGKLEYGSLVRPEQEPIFMLGDEAFNGDSTRYCSSELCVVGQAPPSMDKQFIRDFEQPYYDYDGVLVPVPLDKQEEYLELELTAYRQIIGEPFPQDALDYIEKLRHEAA